MSEDLRRDVITGVACWLATAVALGLNMENAYWATMTAWAMALPGRRIAVSHGLRQIVATAAGCLVGFNVGLRVEGRPGMQLLFIFLIATGGTFLRFRSRFALSWSLGTMSALMLLAYTFYSPVTLYTAAHFRGYEIVCGVGSVMVAQVVMCRLLRFEYPRDLVPAEPAVIDPREALEVALVGGFTVTGVPIIWFFFQLPFASLLITMIAPLIVLDAAFVVHPTRVHWRLVGAVLGGALGALGGALASDSFFLWSVALFVSLAACAQINGSGRPWAAAGSMGGLAVVFSLITANGPSSDSLLILNRILGMVLGIVIMIAVAFAVRLVFHQRLIPPLPAIRPNV